MKARYIDTEVCGGRFGKDRRVRIPVGTARLAGDDDVVIVSLTRMWIEGIPAYEGCGLTADLGDHATERRRARSGAAGAVSIGRLTTPLIPSDFGSLVVVLDVPTFLRICVECGMPVADHKDRCSIRRGHAEMERRKVERQ